MDYSIEVTQTQDWVLIQFFAKNVTKGKSKISPSRLSLTGSSRSSIAWYLGCISPSETKCRLSKKSHRNLTYGGNSVVCDENLGDHPRPAKSLDQLLGRGRALQTSLINYNPVETNRQTSHFATVNSKQNFKNSITDVLHSQNAQYTSVYTCDLEHVISIGGSERTFVYLPTFLVPQ